MRRMIFILAGVLSVLMLFSVACGGDDSTATVTPGAKTTAATTTAAATKTVAATATSAASAELATHLATIKAVLADTIAKAQAGDVQGARDAEGKGDTAMEAIIKATRAVDPSLADAIEKLELDYEAQADSPTTDLTVMIKDAQDALKLLDQAAAKLNITTSAAGSSASAAELKDAMTSITAVLQKTIAKAVAGDVQGARDAEGEGDKAMEAIIKATRLVNPTPADAIEKLELDYEAQADSTTTDLTIMIKDAQEALTLLVQAATALRITP